MSRKILFVTDSLFPLGPAQQLRILTQGLSAEYEIHIAALDVYRDNEFVGLHPNVQLHGLCKGKTRVARLAILVPRLQKLIRSLRADIVHGWCESATAITAFVMQGMLETPFYATELAEQFEKTTLQKLIETRIQRVPDRLVVPHDSLKNHLTEIGIVASRYHVIPNAGMPPTIASAVARIRLIDELGIPADSKIAVAAAPLVARSRLKDLIWAADLLLCVRDDVHFVLFGTGEQEWRLKRFLSLTEARAHVHFMGEPIQAPELVLGGDVFWHSHLREPHPSVMLNVMAQGMPAICVYGPGTEDVIQPQVTGLAVNFGARDEFARWSKYLFELPESAAQLSEQGKQHVLTRFSGQQMCDAYQEMYTAIE